MAMFPRSLEPVVQIINVGSGHLISLLAHFMQPPNWTAGIPVASVAEWDGNCIGFPSYTIIRYYKMIMEYDGKPIQFRNLIINYSI